jgi:predicted dehydrogenase
MTERLKVGIVGGGGIAQVAHLPVLKKLKGVEVMALCDPDFPKARAVADRFGIKDAFDDIEELLRYEALDAVVVCSPNHLHESHILAALSANLHVLAEKPLTMSTASVQRIIRAVEKRDRVVMVGMNHRYRPDVQIVRSFVQSGELGTIESVRGSWHVSRPGRAQLGWRLRKEQSGGGAMLDLGLSVLDLGLWLAGNPTPVRVSASLGPGTKDRAIEPSGSALVVCENGVSLFVDVTWRHIGPGERFGVGLRASKGTAGINPLNVWKELQGTATDVSPTASGSRENAFIASFRAEWAHFQAAIAGEAKPPSLQEQLVLHKILEAIYRSAADGRDVTL